MKQLVISLTPEEYLRVEDHGEYIELARCDDLGPYEGMDLDRKQAHQLMLHLHSILKGDQK